MILGQHELMGYNDKNDKDDNKDDNDDNDKVKARQKE